MSFTSIAVPVAGSNLTSGQLMAGDAARVEKRMTVAAKEVMELKVPLLVFMVLVLLMKVCRTIMRAQVLHTCSDVPNT
jgi:hypothetical protein